MIKIVRFTSPLPDVLRLSSPRLRIGRRLALLSRPNVTLNLCIFFFVLSLVLFPSLLTSPTVSQPKALCSRARSYLSEPRALKSLTRFFAPPLNFLRLPPTSPRPLRSRQVAYPMLKHFPRSGMNFLFTFSIFPGFAFLSFHLDGFYYPH